MSEGDENFDYKAGRHSPASPTDSPGVISWTASEYIEHYRGASWYIALVIGTLVLVALMYFLTKDLFAGVITMVLGIIVASVAHRKPRKIEYELTAEGLKAGDKYHYFSEFRSFALIHEGQLGSLMLIPLKKFAAPISIYIENDDEENIVTLLGEHLPMEERSADKVDTLSRRLRF